MDKTDCNLHGTDAPGSFAASARCTAGKKWEFLLDRARFPSYNVCVVKAVRKTVPFIGKFFALLFEGKNSEPVAVEDRYE